MLFVTHLTGCVLYPHNIMDNGYDIVVIPHSSIIVHTVKWVEVWKTQFQEKLWNENMIFFIFIILTKIVFFHCKSVFVQSVQWRVCNNNWPILTSHATTQYHIWHNSQKRKKKKKKGTFHIYVSLSNESIPWQPHLLHDYSLQNNTCIYNAKYLILFFKLFLINKQENKLINVNIIKFQISIKHKIKHNN